MKKRAKERKLTRVILSALVATGGGLLLGAEAQATGVTITDFSNAVPKTVLNELVPIGTPPSISGFYLGAGYNSLTLAGTPSSSFSNCKYYAGYGTGDVSGYTLTVTGGLNIDGVYGGYSTSAGNVGNNTVTISGGTMGEVEGGYSSTGNVDGNTVTVDGGTISTIRGGDANGGTATNNSVTVNAGTIGEAGGYFVGGRGGNGASSNHVTINGGTIGEISGGIAGGWAVDGSAENNDVTITGGTIGKDAYGVSVVGGFSNSSTGTATGNTVSISGDTTSIAGNVYGGMASYGNATGNTVTIEGGAIDGTIYGGYTNPNSSTVGTVSDNTVTINKEGISLGYIYGGSSMNYSFENGTATGNTVNILAAMTAKGIYGGIVGDGGTSSGNTLNVAAKGVTVTEDGIAGFQNLNFYLPSGVASGDTMLTVTGGTLNSKTDLQGVTFGVAALSGVSLAKNDTVNLITNPNGLTTDATLKTADSASLGTAEFLTANNLATDTKYTLGISKSGDNTIIATVENVTEESGGGSGGGTTAITAEDRLKSPVETRAAAVTLLNAGADMLASQGFAQAANAVALEAAEQAKNAEPGAAAPAASTFTPFAAFGGSSMRAESGSHVDTKGFGINVGFAKEFPNSQGKLLFGPVVEYGGGKYDSYNNDIHGDGKSHYWGVGVMARQVNHDGFYYEGSVRGGRVTSDYGANYPAGRVSYDSSSNYWAAHLGLGKVFAAGAKGTVDGYLKYFYSHQSGDDVTLNGAGERASFDSVDSNRIRVGARYTHKVNEMNSFYGGLAYQYEFGGEARAHYSISGEAPSPSVKGSSGLLELGWQVKPGGPVTIDLGVTGWAGKQRGGSVQLGATWTF